MAVTLGNDNLALCWDVDFLAEYAKMDVPTSFFYDCQPLPVLKSTTKLSCKNVCSYNYFYEPSGILQELQS